MPRAINLRSILAIPAMYDLLNIVVGAHRSRTTFAKKSIRIKPGDRVLDIGCGSGEMYPYLIQASEYTGFDASQPYITAARKRFGNQASFHCSTVNATTLDKPSHYDLVVSYGVLHHLDDDEAEQLCKVAYAALKPGGRLLTCDGCYMPNQSAIVRYLLSRDRGQYVRNQDGYLKISQEVFPDVLSSIHHNLLRIPYTHIFLECRKPLD